MVVVCAVKIIYVFLFLFQRVRELLCKSDEKSIRKEEALKLVMLFGLKYKKRTGVDMKTLEDLLKKKGASDENLKVIKNNFVILISTGIKF